MTACRPDRGCGEDPCVCQPPAKPYPAAKWPPDYGPRGRFGPWHRQAMRLVGRSLERFGAWLDMWSWGGRA